MRTTTEFRERIDPLDPRGIVIFLVLVLLWIGWGFLPGLDSLGGRIAARAAGYLSFGCMLVPYCHIVQRSRRARLGWRMSTWLRLHIAFAYLAFAFLLLHCRAQATSPLTVALLWVTWIVMISGVVGFYGQKWLYFAFAGLKGSPVEVGYERLEPEREELVSQADSEVAELAKQKVPDVVLQFGDRVLAYLQTPYHFLRRRRSEPDLEERRYLHARLLVEGKPQESIDALWQLVEKRRQLESEYRLHRLGRLWLLFHGPASWALLALLLEHVFLSFRYGGY